MVIADVIFRVIFRVIFVVISLMLFIRTSLCQATPLSNRKDAPPPIEAKKRVGSLRLAELERLQILKVQNEDNFSRKIADDFFCKIADDFF